jgi:hypothetical protein
MTNSFINYLVENKVAEESVIIEAIIEQFKNIPTPIEIAYKHNLLSKPNLLRIVNLQSKKLCDFKTACIDLSLWSVEIEKKIEQEVNLVRVPIWEILVKKFGVNLDTLNKSIDGFFATIRNIPSNVSNGNIQIESVSYIEANESDISNFIGTFGLREQADLIDHIQRWKELLESKSYAEAEIQLKEMHFCMQAIQGLARLVNAELTEKIIKKVDEMVHIVSKQKEKVSQEQLQKAEVLAKESVEYIASLQESLKNVKSEQSFYNNKEKQEAYCRTLLLTDQLKKEISEIK